MKALPTFLSLIMLSASCAMAHAQTTGCALSFRPAPNETAFAATGSSLKAADRVCTDDYLIIPFDQKSAAVTLPKGQYRKLRENDTLVAFAPVSIAGDRIDTCLWCDPLKYMTVHRDAPHRLCAVSSLNVESCASDGALSFAVSRMSISEGTQCAPSLMYYGRSGSVLRFAVNDCSSATRPALSYDLSLGNVIRFLDERIEVLNADNAGISFKRLPPVGPDLTP